MSDLFDLRAADCMAKIIDEMIEAGQLDARSRLGDARLDYGTPHVYVHTKQPTKEGVNNQ